MWVNVVGVGGTFSFVYMNLVTLSYAKRETNSLIDRSFTFTSRRLHCTLARARGIQVSLNGAPRRLPSPHGVRSSNSLQLIHTES